MGEVTSSEEHPPLWAREIGELMEQLELDPHEGLSAARAGRALDEYGPNRFEEEADSGWWRMLLAQFTEPLVILLLVAAVISFAIGHRVDALTIMAIVLLNAALGFAQEFKANQAIAALSRMLEPRARVLRGGRAREIEAADLVPGDVVLLDAGDRVSADLRLISAHELQIDESALTGESMAVTKAPAPVDAQASLAERSSRAWMGTIVTSGEARGLVTATGIDTEFGQVARMTGEVDRNATPLQRQLGKLGRQLGGVGLAISLLIILAGWLGGQDLIEMFMMGISLAVAVVPEGLPAVVTVTLALGIRAMVQRNVLLRKLSAAEAIGVASVICTDKTGTLTQNEMSVREIWTSADRFEVEGVGHRPEGEIHRGGEVIDPCVDPTLDDLASIARGCNHAEVTEEDGTWHAVGDPTEVALVVLAGKLGVARAQGKLVTELPFSSERKRMTTVRRVDGRLVALVKGAPDVLLARSASVLGARGAEPLDDERLDAIDEVWKEMASRGVRTLALARRELDEGASL